MKERLCCMLFMDSLFLYVFSDLRDGVLECFGKHFGYGVGDKKVGK